MSETASSILPGMCHDCGGRIGAIRLLLLPSTTRCMACEVAAEATAGGGRWVRDGNDDRRPWPAERDRGPATTRRPPAGDEEEDRRSRRPAA